MKWFKHRRDRRSRCWSARAIGGAGAAAPTPSWSTARSSRSTTASASRRRSRSAASASSRSAPRPRSRSSRGRRRGSSILPAAPSFPGLIDNHAHWVRAAEHDELRFDGVTSRAQALEMLAERVATSKPGEWIAVLGGWSEEQFTDDPRGFPLDELDRIAPNNPVVMQAVYNHSYLNSVALAAAKIDAGTPNPQGGTIEKDAGGKPTGLVRGAGGVAFVAARIPLEDTGGLARQHPQARRLSQLAGRDRLARCRRPRHGRQALRALQASRRPRRAQHPRVLDHDPPAGDAGAGRRGDRRNPRAEAVPGQRLFRPRRLGRVGLCAGDHAIAARRAQHQARGPGADAPRPRRRSPSAASTSTRMSRWTPAIDAFLDVYEAINKETADQGAALVVLAPRPGHRGAARAHEAARHDRADPQPAADPGRADAQGARRQGLGHAAVPARAGFRHPLGPRLRRDRGDDLQSVLHALASR